MKRFFKHIIMTALLLSCLTIYGQEQEVESYYGTMIETHEFDKGHWEKTISDINYGGDRSKDEEVEDYDEEFDINEGNGQNRRRSYSRSFETSEFFSGLMKFLLIGLLVLVIGVLLANIIGKGNILRPSGQKINSDVANFSIEDVEEKLHESDLDRFIREAVEGGNYAMAIRLYYLAVIKELSLSKAIKWKRDKTNKDYLLEMRSSALHQPFKDATRTFERIWYGEHPLNKSEYENLKPRFAELVNQAKVMMPESANRNEN